MSSTNLTDEPHGSEGAQPGAARAKWHKPALRRLPANLAEAHSKGKADGAAKAPSKS